MIANDLIFQKMQPEDISFVAETERLFFTTPWDETALKKGLEGGYETFYLAINEGKKVGYIGYTQTFENVDILTVCICPEYRRLGYAERLLGFCLEQMRQAGAEKVFLEVRQSNYAARALYEKAGFVYLNKRVNYYKEPIEDAFVMIKEMIE